MGLFDKLKETVNEAIGVSNTPSQTPMKTPTSSAPVVGQPTQEQADSASQPTLGEGLYNPQMEKLILLALADGELTEKEKQVLFKKAESMGIDLDEFEMVLDARLYEKNNKQEQSAPVSSAPKSDKYGDVKKCPACGAIVESFTTRCADCGYEFRNVEANTTITALFKKLESLDSQKKGGLFGFSDENIDAQKISIIKTFPIPNTKEDLLEFLSMAAPLGKKKSIFSDDDEDPAIRSAWRDKCAQVIMKARFSMKDDHTLMAEIESYAKELKIK